MALRLALEAGPPFRVGGRVLGEDLEGDVALQLRIVRAIDLAHPAFAEFREDLIGAEPLPDHGACVSVWRLILLNRRAGFRLHLRGFACRTALDPEEGLVVS
jgi:hypothetical protein